MKITRKVPEPQPTLVTLEITLDELIALKTFASYYVIGTDAAHLIARAAKRFVESVPEDIYSWEDTDKLFR